MPSFFQNSDLRKVVQQETKGPPCDQTLGFRLRSISNGTAEGIWIIDERWLNGHQVVMGGFLSAALDDVMGYAMASILTDEQSFTSIDLHTTFHRPAVIGELMVAATIEKAGRTICYISAKAFQQGKCVASAVSSVLVRDVNP